jgi:hypothetical protein
VPPKWNSTQQNGLAINRQCSEFPPAPATFPVTAPAPLLAPVPHFSFPPLVENRFSRFPGKADEKKDFPQLFSLAPLRSECLLDKEDSGISDSNGWRPWTARVM